MTYEERRGPYVINNWMITTAPFHPQIVLKILQDLGAPIIGNLFLKIESGWEITETTSPGDSWILFTRTREV